MVSLVKADKAVTVYATDGWDIDYYTGMKLTNRDIFLLIGRLYSIGYKGEFVVNTANSDIEVVSVRNDEIHVNWNVVRVLDRSEWNA